MLDLTVLPQIWTYLNPGFGEFFHIRHTILIWTVRLPSILKMQEHLRGHHLHSKEDIQNEIKKWLHAQDALFLQKIWQIYIWLR